MKETGSQTGMKMFGVVALTAIALYSLNAALLGKLGLFAFFSHSYSLAYQVMFLIVLTIVAFLWVRRSPKNRSLLVCGAMGAALGYAISIGCLILAFALFGQVDGLTASMERFTDGLSVSPANSLVGFLYAAAITFGWLYGLVVFVLGQVFSAASKKRDTSDTSDTSDTRTPII
jgi:hypothetical protein